MELGEKDEKKIYVSDVSKMCIVYSTNIPSERQILPSNGDYVKQNR